MINIYSDTDSWRVWTDPEGGDREGRCIGVGESEIKALTDARAELQRDLTILDQAIRKLTYKPKSKSKAKP